MAAFWVEGITADHATTQASRALKDALPTLPGHGAVVVFDPVDELLAELPRFDLAEAAERPASPSPVSPAGREERDG